MQQIMEYEQIHRLRDANQMYQSSQRLCCKYIDYFLQQMMNSKYTSNVNSLAYSHGITRGNPQDSSMGLNPNLNIQDEYIENLLKQINFLNLEIKLLKEKQGENKNLGIMGLLNRDQQPLVNHAVESNLKFQSMKGNLQGMVSEMLTLNLLLENENTAVNSQKDYLQEELKKEEEKNFNHRISIEKDISEASDKLKAFMKRYDELKVEHKRISGMYTSIDEEHKKTVRTNKIKSMINEITTNLKKEEEEAGKAVFTEKEEVAKENIAKWTSAENDYKSDPRYIELKEENEALKDKMKKSDRELFDICYKAKEMEELKSLAERNISVEFEIRKQAALQLQKVEEALAEKKEDFDRRLADRKRMSDLEPETKRLETTFATSEKEEEDIKKKNDLSENNYKKLREEILRLTTQLELMKADNAEIIEKEKGLLPEVNNSEAEMSRQQVDLEIKNRDLEKQKLEYYSSKEKLLKLEEEYRYLSSKHKFLEQNVNMDDDLQNLRIEELRGITQNNNMVNEVITEMMSKFDQMRKFAKDSSAIINP